MPISDGNTIRLIDANTILLIEGEPNIIDIADAVLPIGWDLPSSKPVLRSGNTGPRIGDISNVKTPLSDGR